MCYQVWASNTRWYVSNIGLGWQKFPTILPGQEQSAIVLQGALKIRNVNRCPHYNYLAILGSLDVCTGLCKRAEKGLHSLWSYPLFFQWEAQKRKWQALPILWAQSGHLRFSVEPSWVIPGYTNPSSFSSQAPNTLNTLSFSCSEVNLPSLSISCAWSEPWSGEATPGFLELLHPKGSHGFRHLTSPQECWGWTYGMRCSRLSQAGVLFCDTLEMSRVNSRKEVIASHPKDGIKWVSTLGVFMVRPWGYSLSSARH